MITALVILLIGIALLVVKAVFFPAWRRLARDAAAQGASFYVAGGPEIYFYREVNGRLEHAHAEYWPDLRSFGWSPDPKKLQWVPCEKPLDLPRKSLRFFGARSPQQFK
ncbi:hypothetical protein [Aquabacterium humicola]|uniref:hypothetical protein n=1 Tax=Aquabacterium humicola TaxID=3237377 RepID=UPI002543AEA8|nr:hypothetical protein [Rubrivivax pictus]